MNRLLGSDATSAYLQSRPRDARPRRIAPLATHAALVLGAAVAAVGLALIAFSPAAGEAARVDSLPTVSPDGVARCERGAAVLIEGVVAAGGSAESHGFLAYTREVYLGVETTGPNRGRPRWEERDPVTPELQIESDAASVRIRAGAYRLSAPPHVWLSEDEPRYVSLTQTTRRHRGFRAGDRVAVDARVIDAGTVEALVLHGGDAAAYRAAARDEARAERIAGGGLAAFGVLVLAGAALLRRRVGRAAMAGAAGAG